MKKKNPKELYLLAAVCFFIAGIASESFIYFPVGLCMLALGWINWRK